jgi:hypothetical protein
MLDVNERTNETTRDGRNVFLHSSRKIQDDDIMKILEKNWE